MSRRKDKGTGREQKITITASSGLSKDEIERMVRDAESHADEDKRRREEVEVRNQADSAAYQAEKTLRDLGDKISADERSEVEAKIADVRARWQPTTWSASRVPARRCSSRSIRSARRSIARLARQQAATLVAPAIAKKAQHQMALPPLALAMITRSRVSSRKSRSASESGSRLPSRGFHSWFS